MRLPNIYEARYVSGVVAGLKLQELVETGELTQEKHPESFDGEGNIKVGYVGATITRRWFPATPLSSWESAA